MTLSRYVLTANVTVPAGTAGWPAAGPATQITGNTTATPSSGTTIVTNTAGPGTFLLGWTAQLETAAAGGDANNFGLYAGSTLLATSVNTGTISSFPQPAVTFYAESSEAITVKNIAAGSAGSVYAATLSVTPMMGGDNRGTLAWTGAGAPSAWSPGAFPVTLMSGTAIVLDPAGPLYAAIGAANLQAWIDGTDNVGHAALSN